jgi:hypothetical protein
MRRIDNCSLTVYEPQKRQEQQHHSCCPLNIEHGEYVPQKANDVDVEYSTANNEVVEQKNRHSAKGEEYHFYDEHSKAY